MSDLRRISTVALVIAGTCLTVAEAKAASADSCPVAGGSAEPAKAKRGLGGLLGAARGAGVGSLMGAVRGERNIVSNLESAARAAATDAVTNAAEGCAQAALAAAEDAAASDTGSANASSPAEPAKPTRKPAAAAAVKYPNDLPKPGDFSAVKAAYDGFGKVACTGCEGGFAYDGWAVFPRDEHSGKYNGDAQRIGSWPVGHVHRWTGNESNGTLTVVAEETVGGFRCRTLKYRLTKGSASAERPGLLCWGRASSFFGSESWVQVY